MRLRLLEKINRLKVADCAIACALTTVSTWVLASPASTQQIRTLADAVQEVFSAGSVNSLERAEAVLREVHSANVRIEWLGYDLELACYQRFFTQACLNEVKASVRDSQHKLRSLEIEAEQFKRYERDRQNELERQRKISEAEREAAALSQEFEQRQREFAERQAQTLREQAEQEARAAERAAAAEQELARRSARASEHEAKRRAEAEAAPQRRENVKAFEQKQKEAQERQQKMQEKKLKPGS